MKKTIVNSQSANTAAIPATGNAGNPPRFSIFKHPIQNVYPQSRSIGLRNTYSLIKSGAFSRQTQHLRSIQDKQKARSFKANNFYYVTFSGIFQKRSDQALVQHSGLLTIDIDHIESIDSIKALLLNDRFLETALLFTSPSGDGLKWIVHIDIQKESHCNYFLAILNYLKHTYKIDIDKSGKDLSRACFLSHDPSVYINPKHL